MPRLAAFNPCEGRSAERKPARIAVVGRDVVRTPPRCEAHRHLSAKPSGRTAGDVLQCSTDELRAGCASHIPHATGKTWPRTASAVWTVRCPAACSWRAVQLEGHRVGPKPTSLRRMKVQGVEAAAVRALRGGQPSCAAASRAETSDTIGLCHEQSSLRRRKERGKRGCAQFVSSGQSRTEADEPAAQEGARG